MTRSAPAAAQASADASVVFTSSGVGRRGKPYWGAYAVSKFGVEGLMQVLASELEGTTASVPTA
jgi:NAD(P)-dependent dehydrogenase (short-subunit alcohol dehydrogenase family)